MENKFIQKQYHWYQKKIQQNIKPEMCSIQLICDVSQMGMLLSDESDYINWLIDMSVDRHFQSISGQKSISISMQNKRSYSFI